jgi:hypothetical protein
MDTLTQQFRHLNI